MTCKAWVGRVLTGAERQDLETDIGLFIGSAFRQNTDYKATKTKPSSRFSFSRLAQELHGQFPELESIEFDNADIANGMEVPRINSLGVTIATA